MDPLTRPPDPMANHDRRLTRRRAAALLLTVVATPLVAGYAVRNDGDGTDGTGLVDWPDSADTGSKPGDRAPNFRLSTLAGGETTLADEVAAGRPVVLNFFATWCASCREEMPILDAAHGRIATVLGIDLREGPDRVRGLLGETGARYPILLDRDGTVTRAYDAISLPATCVVAPAGAIRRLIFGPVTGESLAAAIVAATR